MAVEGRTKKSRQGGLMDTVKVVIHALILAMIVRVFFYQPFNIPSGSMKETLLIGGPDVSFHQLSSDRKRTPIFHLRHKRSWRELKAR